MTKGGLVDYTAYAFMSSPLKKYTVDGGLLFHIIDKSRLGIQQDLTQK